MKNQVPQVSFNVVDGDLISFLTLGSDINLFGYDLILFVSNFNFKELSVMLVASLINFGVKNQVPQVSFKIVARDLMSFHTFGSDMRLFGSYIIFLGSRF